MKNAKEIKDQRDEYMMNYIKKMKEDELEGKIIKKQVEEALEEEKVKEQQKKDKALKMREDFKSANEELLKVQAEIALKE